MENFIYSLQATLPIFLLIILGKVLHRLHIIDAPFTKIADKYVFNVALPALVFIDLTENSGSRDFDGRFVLFCFLVTLSSIIGIWALTSLFMKKKEEQGAFIQGAYRSSAAILGLAFIDNMYSDVGMAPLMIIGSVPLFNIFAVIILTIKGANDGQKPNIKTTLISIAKNPILIGIALALLFTVCDFHLPVFLNKTLDNIANTASPLALLSIGATFEGRKAIKKIRPTLLASFIKLILLAALFLPLAVYFGYRNQELIAILIMLASPTTVSSYIMVKNTANDHVLTSSIIVFTTLLSSVTLTIWIFVLRTLGLI